MAECLQGFLFKTNTMKMLLFSFFILLIVLSGCDKIKKTHLDQNARFPDIPVNLVDLNSSYDDFNSILPETHFGKAFVFSSNRRTNGGEFDLISDNIHATWFMETSELVVDNSYFWQNTNYVAQLLNKVPNAGNQFGPYSIGFDTVIEGIQKRVNILTYSNNHGSYTYQEEFVYHESLDGGETGTVKGPISIHAITDPEKQYISFYGPSVQSIDDYYLNPNNFTQLYFNKTENGKSKIYKINIPDSVSFLKFLMDSAAYQQVAVVELSSDQNDFCPFINGNLMVFTSDRPGGFGGYDLYYSFFDGTTWSEPLNFGEKINSSFDEFRPVAVNVFEFKNDLLIFSSNRPGGTGGYDLYYVGIDKFGLSSFIN